MPGCLFKVPIFLQLSAEEQAHIHEFIRPKNYSKGEYIQLAGDYNPQLLILNRGDVKLTRTSKNGDEQLLRRLVPGDYIGDMAVFANAAADYDAVALADSTFCTLNSPDLHELLRTYPDLGIKIIADLSLKLTKAEEKIEALTLRSADERLLQALVEYAAGKPNFTLNSAKKDIASQIGVRPETLSRSFKQLQQKGFIKVDGNVIELLTTQL